jgi:hypothetical protein
MLTSLVYGAAQTKTSGEPEEEAAPEGGRRLQQDQTVGVRSTCTRKVVVEHAIVATRMTECDHLTARLVELPIDCGVDNSLHLPAYLFGLVFKVSF